MTWMGDPSEEPEKMGLSDEVKQVLLKSAEFLNTMADSLTKEPYDPKVPAHLRMAADCLLEQVQLDKIYPWPDMMDMDLDPSGQLFLFLDNEEEKAKFVANESLPNSGDFPSSEELQSWFGGGEKKDGDNG